MEELTDRAVLCIVPETKDLRCDSSSAGIATGLAAEDPRKLRTDLRFVNIDKPPRAVVIASVNPAEGKSIVAANLAACRPRPISVRSSSMLPVTDAGLLAADGAILGCAWARRSRSR